ncbi:MAG: ribonuclease P protein component [Rhodospirillaceae bacterium]|nr:ribonuclease P protein component [Rhodospirillaceae bacterium]
MGRAWGHLQDRSDFLRAANKGVRKGTPAFLIQAVRPAASETGTPESASLRIGFTATRKLGNAVIRNRAKRRLRAAADAVMADLSGSTADLVLIARPDALSRSFTHMTDDLRRAAEHVLRQIGSKAGKASS